MHKLHAELVAELDEEFMNCETEYGFSAATVGTILKRFFNRVVCVERGDSSERHGQADILHAYIEGAKMQISFDGGKVWHDKMETAIELYDIDYRLKEDEQPVDEWQWYAMLNGKAVIQDKFMTEEEANQAQFDDCKFYKLEMTKQKRESK